jgi:hypothetical protein
MSWDLQCILDKEAESDCDPEDVHPEGWKVDDSQSQDVQERMSSPGE